MDQTDRQADNVYAHLHTHTKGKERGGDKWMDGQSDGQMDGRPDRWEVGGVMAKQTEGQSDGLVDRMYGQISNCTHSDGLGAVIPSTFVEVAHEHQGVISLLVRHSSEELGQATIIHLVPLEKG